MRDEVSAFLGRSHSHVLAPAGCGKTELVAAAIAAAGDGPHLILTHTHAGVAALSSRLEKHAVPAGKARVGTILAWAFALVRAFPRLAGVGPLEAQEPRWPEICGAARALLGRRHIRSMLQRSYASVVVDEYQDCTRSQHALVERLADLLPVRVLGDPLQAVYGFDAMDPLPDWHVEVSAAFPCGLELNEPHRWNGHNAALGRWLTEARPRLVAREEIGLAGSPVRWRQYDPAASRDEAFRLLDSATSSGVVLLRWPQEARGFARRLGGRMSMMEEVEGKDLVDACSAISEGRGLSRALAVLDFARECYTGLSTGMNSFRDALAAGRAPAVRGSGPLADAKRQLLAVAGSEDLQHVRIALTQLAELDGVSCFRRELAGDMKRSLASTLRGDAQDLREAAIAMRRASSRRGRLGRVSVSHILLVKGLQYDDVVLVNPDSLTAQELYVGLTRGRRSLVVLSANPVLRAVE